MSSVDHVRPGRLRRRLAIAFVLACGVSTGALAAGVYVLVRQERLQASVNSALVEARASLGQAHLSAGQTQPTPLGGDFASHMAVSQLAAFYSLQGGYSTVIAPSGRVPSGLLPVPPDLHRLVTAGHIAYERLTVHGEPKLAVGLPDSLDRVQLYLYFDERPLWADLDHLRDVLIGAWLVVLAGSAAAGMVLARRMLAPVGAASDAARSLAEGLLDTRLPAGGRDEFGAWAASFNSMAEALQGKITELTEAEARERRFTADVAHELRTPLTALVNEAALLSAHADGMPDEARRMTELLTGDLRRMRRLVDDLMEISRLDAGQEQLELAEADVHKLLEGLCAARGWGTDVTIRPGPQAVVSTDRRRLERILANLIGNAIEHGGGHADVRIDPAADGLAIQVADAGPGIPAEFRSRLFDRFSKADTSRSQGGSGLGLAIAAENAALIGARIDVSPADSAGTRFTLYLPNTPGRAP